jgi:hypothetical protein
MSGWVHDEVNDVRISDGEASDMCNSSSARHDMHRGNRHEQVDAQRGEQHTHQISSCLDNHN